MRPLRALMAAIGILLFVADASADPTAASGYRLETVSKPALLFPACRGTATICSSPISQVAGFTGAAPTAGLSHSVRSFPVVST